MAQWAKQWTYVSDFWAMVRNRNYYIFFIFFCILYEVEIKFYSFVLTNIIIFNLTSNSRFFNMV